MPKFSNLEGPFGVLVTDVDFAKPQEAETVKNLVSAFYHHSLMVIRGQSLTNDQFARFGEIWGRPQPHFLEAGRLTAYPTITFLTNRREARPDMPVNSAAYWHTDNSYEAEPASVTMLYAVELPSNGKGTRVANMYHAYEALPQATKEKIDDLHAVHFWGNRDAGKEGENDYPLTSEQRAKAEIVTHPLVLQHPVTGRKALYGVSGSSHRIVGLADDAANDLLMELKTHATKPEFINDVPIREGDITIWDNLATLHAAPVQQPASPGDRERRMHRISVKGLSPYVAVSG